MQDSELGWLQLGSLEASSVGIKEEPFEPPHPLSPPPDIPSLPSSYAADFSPSGPCRGRHSSTLSLAGVKRVRPYPSLKHGSLPRSEDLGMMSNAAGDWSLSGMRSGNGRLHANAQRRGSDPEILSYSYGQTFVPVSEAYRFISVRNLNLPLLGICEPSARFF